MRRIALAIVLFASLVRGADTDVRVQLFAFSDTDQALAAQVERQTAALLESTNGVMVVKKQPDIFLSMHVTPVRSGAADFVMVAYDANSIVPSNIAAALLRGQATSAGIHNAQALLSGLVSSGLPLGIFGPRENLAKLCADIARSVEATAIAQYRKSPTDSDTDVSLEHFMLRIGALPVVKP